MRLRAIMSENKGWRWVPRKGPDWLPLDQIGVDGVRGFCPAGSTSTQLPSDQLEGCLVGFVEDGQIVHS